jgi:hypothetical protein
MLSFDFAFGITIQLFSLFFFGIQFKENCKLFSFKWYEKGKLKLCEANRGHEKRFFIFFNGYGMI